MIYVAAPLFNDFERQRNLALASSLEIYDRVFLPQRDCGLLTDAVRAGKSVNVAETEVFFRDVEAMDGSSLVVAVLDGAVIDEGVAFELGYSYARAISCVGLQTDSRRQLPTGNNPMIGGCLVEVFTSEIALIDWIADEYFGKHRASSTNTSQRSLIGSQ